MTRYAVPGPPAQLPHGHAGAAGVPQHGGVAARAVIDDAQPAAGPQDPHRLAQRLCPPAGFPDVAERQAADHQVERRGRKREVTRVRAGKLHPAAHALGRRGLQRGLAFFTDLTSDKGTELAANPQAAAVLHWLRPVHRQVRVAGPVEPVSEEEANEYWRTRPAATRRNAAASYQSSVIANQAALQTRVKDMQLRHPADTDLPRPQRWGGFRVLPDRVEFWQESPDGLHDRIRYRRASNNWTIERLSP